MSAMESLLGTSTSEGDVVGGKATGFATKAGFAAALTGITGVVIAAVQQFAELKVDPALKVAALALVGIGALAWAIASAGDVIARAYASAHVVPAPKAGEEPTPVLQWALSSSGGSPSPLAAALQALAASTAAAAGGPNKETPPSSQLVAVPAGTRVNYQNMVLTAFALRPEPEKPDTVSLLVAGVNESPRWVDASATTIAP